MPEQLSYVLGLDLGQSRDPSALTVLERRGQLAGQVYAVQVLHRWPLGTPYPLIVEDVRALLSDPRLASSTLAVDATGCGRPVVDYLARSQLGCGFLVSVTITAGHKAAQDPDARWPATWTVPKRDLAGLLQLLLGNGRLLIAADLQLGPTLATELQTFTVKVNIATGNESFEAWREGQHDDLVLAVALAAWAGERYPAWGPGAIGTGKDGTYPVPPGGVFASDLRPGGTPRGVFASDLRPRPPGVW